MSNLKIQRIEVPELNIDDYGSKISEQFNNIDINFQALANSDFFTGARGKGLKLIEVEPTSSDTFEFREDLEFHDESILEGSAGTALKNSIINAFKKYNKSNTTWYVGKKYVLYIDNNKKVHNIYPIIYTSETVGVDGNTSQDNSYLDFEYVNKVLTLTKSKGYPSLYYDADKKKYCWLINGAKTGIVAQGKDGLNGLPGPGVDFDVLEVETEPLTDDGFYKISRVYWPKYQMWQNFYLNISSEDGNLNAGGSGYPATDIEWLSGGRDEWINSYGSKTFLVSRTLIEYEEVEDGGTYIKNGDSYIPISNIYIKNNDNSYSKITATYIKESENKYVKVTNGLGDYIENKGSYELIKTIHVENDGKYTQLSKNYTAGEAYVQKEIPVLHLCKLIHKSALNIKQRFDKVDVDPVKPDTGGIIVDDNKELIDPKTDTVVEEATTNNSEPVLMTAAITPNQTGPIIAIDKTTIGSMAPVFSTVVSDETKQKFTETYDNNKKFVNEISTGKVTSIQYVSNGNKLVEVSLEGSLGSQIKASTAHYADDIYGVYLTKENMHSLTSTISSGSTTGVSLAFDDINWNTANNYALRCLYLKDCAYANGGGIPSSGILIYNSTRLDIDSSNPNGTTGTLNMRYVGDVGDYKKGDTTADPDNKDNADNVKSLILNLGANGVLETGGVNVGNGKLSVKRDEVKGDKVNITIPTTITNNLTVGAVDNSTEVTINGPTTISDDLIVKDKLTVETRTNEDKTTQTHVDIGTDDNQAIVTINGPTIIDENLTVNNSISTNVIGGLAANDNDVSPKIKFVTYGTPTTNAPAVTGPAGGTTTGGSQTVVGDDKQEVDTNNNQHETVIGGDKQGITTEDPMEGVVGGGDKPVVDPGFILIKNEALDLANMQMVDVPQILFNIITGLYNGKTWDNIDEYSNTTWVSKNYELKIKPFKIYPTDHEIINPSNYLCYHITGYIECFDPSTVGDDDVEGYVESNVYLNRLNIDTIVRTKVETNSSNEIEHKDLSLRIYSGVRKWGEDDYFALPYICENPNGTTSTYYVYEVHTDKILGVDEITNDVDSYWEIKKSPDNNLTGKYLVIGRVNMSSINGPYLVDTVRMDVNNVYRVMQSVWFTTTHYDPATQS